MNALEAIKSLKMNVSKSIIGQEKIVERLIIALLANGNLLLEGLPGLAKTRAIKSLAKNLHSDFSRIQFTPDLLPSDITGSEIYYSEDGKGKFKFEPGPLFGNLILADEINRAPAKVQAALLEAMEERQITVAGTVHKLPELFMVLATQNPIEQEGTYPLPEAQMDRFLMKVVIEYPSIESEEKVLQLVRNESKTVESDEKTEQSNEMSEDNVFVARKEIDEVYTSPNIEKYIVQLINATRFPKEYGDNLTEWIKVGASPRGTIALDKSSRVYAWMMNRDHVTPEDVKAIVNDVLRHRLILTYEANAQGMTTDDVIDEIVKVVAVA
ncbi:MAG: AAA family ATPase [Bacteroidota bacterium]